MSYAIQSATKSNGTYCAYKALWFEVIRVAFLSAIKGDRGSLIWLNATDGRFEELCQMLNLDAQQIRSKLKGQTDE